jgi:hypothetical protein
MTIAYVGDVVDDSAGPSGTSPAQRTREDLGTDVLAGGRNWVRTSDPSLVRSLIQCGHTA